MATETLEAEISQSEFDEASRRGQERLRRGPVALGAHYDPTANLIVIDLNWGYSFSFPPQRVQGLATAQPQQLAEIEITAAGLGIYFPLLDEDIGVQNMVLEGRFGNDRWEAAWAAANLPTQAA